MVTSELAIYRCRAVRDGLLNPENFISIVRFVRTTVGFIVRFGSGGCIVVVVGWRRMVFGGGDGGRGRFFGEFYEGVFSFVAVVGGVQDADGGLRLLFQVVVVIVVVVGPIACHRALRRRGGGQIIEGRHVRGGPRVWPTFLVELLSHVGVSVSCGVCGYESCVQQAGNR